mmetsp:Transcript_34900/g.104050  ORF Transcript_34900/g.104050 Transcript_34900/m.104050 type:complete len:397 (-) Transcript_34900:40-1230(-)
MSCDETPDGTDLLPHVSVLLGTLVLERYGRDARIGGGGKGEETVASSPPRLSYGSYAGGVLGGHGVHQAHELGHGRTLRRDLSVAQPVGPGLSLRLGQGLADHGYRIQTLLVDIPLLPPVERHVLAQYAGQRGRPDIPLRISPPQMHPPQHRHIGDPIVRYLRGVRTHSLAGSHHLRFRIAAERLASAGSLSLEAIPKGAFRGGGERGWVVDGRLPSFVGVGFRGFQGEEAGIQGGVVSSRRRCRRRRPLRRGRLRCCIPSPPAGGGGGCDLLRSARRGRLRLRRLRFQQRFSRVRVQHKHPPENRQQAESAGQGVPSSVSSGPPAASTSGCPSLHGGKAAAAAVLPLASSLPPTAGCGASSGRWRRENSSSAVAFYRDGHWSRSGGRSWGSLASR